MKNNCRFHLSILPYFFSRQKLDKTIFCLFSQYFTEEEVWHPLEFWFKIPSFQEVTPISFFEEQFFQ